MSCFKCREGCSTSCCLGPRYEVLDAADFRRRFVCFKCRRSWKAKYDRWREQEVSPHWRHFSLYTPIPDTRPVENEMIWSDPEGGEAGDPIKCAGCGETPFITHEKFRPPKRKDVKGWKALEKRIQTGDDEVFRHYCPWDRKMRRGYDHKVMDKPGPTGTIKTVLYKEETKERRNAKN